MRSQRLPDAELEVMQAVWACDPPVSRNAIERIVHKTHPMAATTILTLLSRLVERHYLLVEKSGRRNGYTPVVSRQEYLASQGKRFFSKLCGGDIRVFAAALCDSGLGKEDIDELRRLLEADEL